MRFYSPLRYPGGKSKLVPLVKLLIKNSGREGATYIEPFAGGAGVALSLLLDGTVERIVINDYDKAVYSVWRAIKREPSELIRLIDKTPVTIDEWQRQRAIYIGYSRGYSVELAFAALFLNRVNRSGIITGGPIGGFAQEGDWKLDVRFNKTAIIERVNDVSKRRNAIKVYNQDIIRLVDSYVPQFADEAFIYFDPPYFNKANKLYKNALSHGDHVRIADRILNNVACPWMLTYDDVPEIRALYQHMEIRRIDLTYSAANKGKASEIIVCSDSKFYPSYDDICNDIFGLNMRN
ncbi:MAG: DNA adenine methylase [Deltaproteobacteria bacterium]|jgi:DNA adenine methylase|nr:DNA adenine methylase [Deltaproteobacteria bacterium]